MIPHLIIKKGIPKNLPKEYETIVAQLKKCTTKQECLKHAFVWVTTKFRGSPLRRDFFSLWIIDLGVLFAKEYLHCTTLNYILRVLLVKSGHFKDSEIHRKITFTGYVSPHQYLSIDLHSMKVAADPWAYRFGIDLGDYAHGLHWKT